ncbi:hypothetical protein J3Q64DRAFT_1818099 [Phycomyces blakesleeanus]|uniref:Carbohydrate kinase FGGY C-terminal domain-containing protein n=2 Tax=Phycomyces blakesleeanus TaxID=4837 RepID=A0A167QII0_PHYB8|nr:hypothetical protein PHYBLDRAFT_121390 [Phycomyces blakesleeanus NRRL 1555(-)]OAD79748.1 hypothetical protein PHYBLDRAFT_121390 [Phycomyces blakesleeanus NRRL 1555(-)]|eukprot:XP_018297788.1 hypothetical protein PHYBLDRAFT_121390 [Phycomyces blakesleeanus NRRL 1555(-)]
MSKESYYVGIDVGTGSARAGVIDSQGTLVSISVEPITTWNPKHDIYEQSTANIWANIAKTVREAVRSANLTSDDIKGVGFDATCSLVALDNKGQPRSVDIQSGFQDDSLNVILWADHRAIDQARRINATKHNVLRYVGNTISPEMEIPKTLWLKENMPPAKWDSLAYIMDLPDFLTFKATGHTARSTCSLTCKCSYLPPKVGQGWDASYFEAIGLGCLVKEDWKRLGGETNGGVLHAGDKVGKGLTAQAAAELGLKEGTPVGSAVIDAYAGAIATLGATASKTERDSMLHESTSLVSQGSHRLAIICGTSSCHIAMSPDPIFVPGVWGPYRSVLVPDMWCAEGGQSSTGQLIDHTLSTHPAIKEARDLAAKEDLSIYAFLNRHLEKLQSERQLSRVEDLTRHLHIYPDYHGNRSPLADPTLRGTIVGVSLDKSIDDLASRYLATLQAIACQTRHIIESMNQKGYTIDTLCLSGGLCKNPLFVQTHSNITQCRVILPESIEGAVVVGAAFLGAKAATGQDLWDVMVSLGKAGRVIEPCKNQESIEQDNRRYKVFLAMLEDQKKYRQIMDGLV